jgi:hypothetical protein
VFDELFDPDGLRARALDSGSFGAQVRRTRARTTDATRACERMSAITPVRSLGRPVGRSVGRLVGRSVGPLASANPSCKITTVEIRERTPSSRLPKRLAARLRITSDR